MKRVAQPTTANTRFKMQSLFYDQDTRRQAATDQSQNYLAIQLRWLECGPSLIVIRRLRGLVGLGLEQEVVGEEEDEQRNPGHIIFLSW